MPRRPQTTCAMWQAKAISGCIDCNAVIRKVSGVWDEAEGGQLVWFDLAGIQEGLCTGPAHRRSRIRRRINSDTHYGIGCAYPHAATCSDPMRQLRGALLFAIRMIRKMRSRDEVCVEAALLKLSKVLTDAQTLREAIPARRTR